MPVRFRPFRLKLTFLSHLSFRWKIILGFLTVLAINFIGDGLRDVLDPRKVM